MKKSVLIIVVLAIIIAVAILVLIYAKYTGFAVSNPQTSVTRTARFSSNVKLEYTTITVTLTVKSRDFALGVSEKIPPGFKVASVTKNGVITTDTVEWLFVPGVSAGVGYTLKANLTVRNLNFSGSWYSQDKEGNITGTNFLKR